MLKSKTIGSSQEVIFPEFPDDDNTVTTTVTKSRRVSFGTNFIKEFIVGSAVSANCVLEYEQAVLSSDSSNANSSHSAVESDILDPDPPFIPENSKMYSTMPPIFKPPDFDSTEQLKPAKFQRTICFSADSPTADMEFTEGCITLAKSILDKKNKDMTVIIQAKSKDSKEEERCKKEDVTKYFDGSQLEISETGCLKFRENRREERRFESDKTEIFNKFDDEMSITACDKVFKMRRSKIPDDSDFTAEESKENRMPLDLIMRQLDRDDSDSDLFNPEKSFSDFLNAQPFDFSGESEKLGLNESMDISRDFPQTVGTTSEPPIVAVVPVVSPVPAVPVPRVPVLAAVPVVPTVGAVPVFPVVSVVSPAPAGPELPINTAGPAISSVPTIPTVPFVTAKPAMSPVPKPLIMTAEPAMSSIPTVPPVPIVTAEPAVSPVPVVPIVHDELPVPTLPAAVIEAAMSPVHAVSSSSTVSVVAAEAALHIVPDEPTAPVMTTVPAVPIVHNELTVPTLPSVALEATMSPVAAVPVVSSVSFNSTLPIVAAEADVPVVPDESTAPVSTTVPAVPVVAVEQAVSSIPSVPVVSNEPTVLAVPVVAVEQAVSCVSSNPTLPIVPDEPTVPVVTTVPAGPTLSDVNAEPAMPVQSVVSPVPTGHTVLVTPDEPAACTVPVTETCDEQPYDEESFADYTENYTEPLLVDVKVVESLEEQSKESNCLWSLQDVLFSKSKILGLLSFNCTLLKSQTLMKFALKKSKEDRLDSCSVVTESSIHLKEDATTPVHPEYNLVLRFGFKKQEEYFNERKQKISSVFQIPYFLDEINSFMTKLNCYLGQVYDILISYPGSTLKGAVLSFRLFSFPILFSSTVSIDLTNLFRLSDSSLSFKHDIGHVDEKIIRDIFQECSKQKNNLCEFIIRSNKYLYDMERGTGWVSKRSHIRLLPAELIP